MGYWTSSDAGRPRPFGKRKLLHPLGGDSLSLPPADVNDFRADVPALTFPQGKGKLANSPAA